MADQSREITAVPVTDRHTVRAWVRLPRTNYRADPAWVPPLWLAEPAEARASRGGARVVRFVAFDGARPVGRIACSLYPGFDVLHLGGYEAVDDDRVPSALFAAAAHHARAHGRTTLVGPEGHPLFDTAGIQVSGFENVLPAGTPHHRPYYRRQWEEVGGFEPSGTVFTFVAERADQQIPDWLRQVAQRAEAEGYRSPDFHRFRELALHTDALARLANVVVAETTGFSALHPRDVKAMRRRLRFLLGADLTRLVFHGDTLVGALAGMPELGRGLQRAHGRLLPLGWWWLLQARRRGDTVTINGAFVHPDHQDRGAIAVAALPLISGVLADHRWQRIYAAMVEADNVRSRMLAEDALGAVPAAEYRVYRRAVDVDDTAGR